MKMRATWTTMHQRCNDSRVPAWPNYGGRGIKVCERWDTFENFLADMGPKPTPRHTLDRIDNDGNYEPGNCRWATRQEQANNRRSNVKIEWNGQERTLAEWSRLVGLSKSTLSGRLKRGLPVELALTGHHQHRRILTWNGKTQTLEDWAQEIGISTTTLSARLDKLGWPLERALTTPLNHRRLTLDGRTQSMTAWAEALGITTGALSLRLTNGWPLERALRERKKQTED